MPPSEGFFSDLLHDSILQSIEDLGYEWVWVGDEFCTERKLYWIDDLKGVAQGPRVAAAMCSPRTSNCCGLPIGIVTSRSSALLTAILLRFGMTVVLRASFARRRHRFTGASCAEAVLRADSMWNAVPVVSKLVDGVEKIGSRA